MYFEFQCILVNPFECHTLVPKLKDWNNVFFDNVNLIKQTINTFYHVITQSIWMVWITMLEKNKMMQTV